MPKCKAKTIKGLSIACIILSALYMLAFVIGGVAIGALVEYYDPIMDSIKSNVSSGSYGFSYDLQSHSHVFDDPYYGYGYGYDYYDDIIDNAYLLPILQFGMIAIVVCFIMQAISLVAGIIMLINSSKPQKLGVAFGWGLAGAILSVLSGGIVQTVLFVLAIVFIYKDQQLYKSGQYPMPYAQVQPQPAPVPGNPAPVQPVPTQVPVQPAPGAYPAQPTPGTTPVVTAGGAPAATADQATAATASAQTNVDSANAAQGTDQESVQTMQTVDEIIDPAVTTETTEVVEVSESNDNADNKESL